MLVSSKHEINEGTKCGTISCDIWTNLCIQSDNLVHTCNLLYFNCLTASILTVKAVSADIFQKTWRYPTVWWSRKQKVIRRLRRNSPSTNSVYLYQFICIIATL
jgi:hypothetical protein